MNNETLSYYVLLTLNELIDGLQGIIRNSKDLTGEELVIDAEYVTEENTNGKVPPGSIGIFLQQNTLDPDEPKYGTIVLASGRTQKLM